MRDGAYLLADVFRPANSKRHPVIMNLGVYGKSFQRECICNEEDMLARENWKTLLHRQSRRGGIRKPRDTGHLGLGSRRLHRDSGGRRGICNTPDRSISSVARRREDFYDAIEWAAAEPWSNGRVGLWGMSYYAINQHAVAALQPPGLEAMISGSHRRRLVPRHSLQRRAYATKNSLPAGGTRQPCCLW